MDDIKNNVHDRAVRDAIDDVNYVINLIESEIALHPEFPSRHVAARLRLAVENMELAVENMEKSDGIQDA